MYTHFPADEMAGGLVGACFTILTINADKHALMKRFHKPAIEKLMQRSALFPALPHQRFLAI
ncbi:MAG: hypothetical protein KJ852_04230 [Gammaproteobacteria bacterium]|nr:hypothetical protein [Gammaproteobacteria bacterium]MBU0786602.1 hypothetical protein [Gammaproteobacteria bacterium]MBU0814327.1 hypothetical protein [Gammaproteobacteria bacterium]MBU1786153.1 hypothetical protein [Gammaproteobacteria bacterium]